MFLTVTLAPALGLVWLGWNLLRQDRDLERQRQADRLGLAADRIVADLARELDTLESELPHWLSSPPDALALEGALVVSLGAGGVEQHAGAPLVFRPTVPVDVEPPASIWVAGEVLEHQRKDYAAAAAVYGALAKSNEPQVRAGALLRLARSQRVAGRLAEAAETYGRLQAMDVQVAAEPAALVAGRTRCGIFQALGRLPDRDREAQALVRDLEGGRWPLDRSSYFLALHQARRAQFGCSLDADASALASDLASLAADDATALADSVDTLWHEVDQSGAAPRDAPGRNRKTRWIGQRGVFVVSISGPDSGRVVLVAPSRFLEARWRHVWEGQETRVTFVDIEGHRLLESAPASAGGPEVVRQAPDTALPWTLRVGPIWRVEELGAVGTRRRLLFAGLALVTFVMFAGSYIVGRAIRRELAFGRLQREFVSAVSHEFRTPLTSIGHLVDNLRSGRPIADDRRRQYYDVLADETKRLQQFVETTLDFGRMEAGAARYHFADVDLARLVSEVVAGFRQELVAHPREVALSPSGALPAVRADPQALALALHNLLDNAAKYSSDGEPIDVALERGDGAVIVRVRDKGPGIPPLEQSQIFQKFVRGDAARRAGVKGTGLGLALVDHIVRAHGGRVELESESGRGSTFSIALPVAGTEAG